MYFHNGCLDTPCNSSPYFLYPLCLVFFFTDLTALAALVDWWRTRNRLSRTLCNKKKYGVCLHKQTREIVTRDSNCTFLKLLSS